MAKQLNEIANIPNGDNS